MAHPRSPILILAPAVLAACLPFANKAFHVDDRIYLEVADNILRKPLYPYDYPAVFEGFVAPDAASHSHLPLTSYYLALLKWLVGSDVEWVFHIAFLVFPLLAVWSFYDLARRFVRHPRAAALLLLFSPAFLVLSHNLMTDVAFLAFWLLALSRFLRLCDGAGARKDWVLCALGLLGAGFISLLSAGLVLLMTGYLLVVWWKGGEERLDPRLAAGLILVLALPLLLWFFWYLRAYLHYDRLVLVNMLLHVSYRDAFSGALIGQKGLSFILNAGGALLFPLAIGYAFSGRWKTRLFLAFFLLCWLPFYPWLPGYSAPHIFLFALFLSSGALVLWEFLSLLLSLLKKSSPAGDLPAWAVGPADRGLLLLWFFGIFAAYLFFFYSGSVRYSLLVLPPVILVWIRALELRVRDDYFRRNLVGLGVVLTAALGLSVAHADYEFASVYRRNAREIREEYAVPGRTVWYAGEWGFRYYIEKEGAKILPKTAVGPREGDIIVKPFVAMPWVTLYDSGEYIQVVEQRHARVRSPIRLLDFGSHAGFYSTGWGLLPFSLAGPKNWEWFNVFRVLKAYEGPIPEQERPW